MITLNPTEYQTHRLTEQNSALSNLQANYDFTRSVSQSGCPAVSSEFRCDCTFKNLLSQQIRPRKLWNYTTAKNFQLKAALTIFTDAASAVTAVTKNSLYPIMMRLRQTRCQLLWTWATHCEYSQAGEKAVCAQSTRSTGGGGIGSEFCLGVDASVWAVQSCCCCCWSQAGQSTPGHLTATEGVRGVCFQINKKAL